MSFGIFGLKNAKTSNKLSEVQQNDAKLSLFTAIDPRKTKRRDEEAVPVEVRPFARRAFTTGFLLGSMMRSWLVKKDFVAI